MKQSTHQNFANYKWNIFQGEIIFCRVNCSSSNEDRRKFLISRPGSYEASFKKSKGKSGKSMKTRAQSSWVDVSVNKIARFSGDEC